MTTPTSPWSRAGERPSDAFRPLCFELDYVKHPLGSVLISLGDTRVLCNCTVENSLPSWMKGQQRGWLTAEYSLLPASTHTRSRRERSSVGGRTQEIQRLIGRSLRACLDTEALGERTMLIDCDVLQADGGTR
ncbi:MAG: ribonuclease PH, partial [Myxococcota bacterium]|nr:ribonuclease PH [Myxococcota bacterium]